MKATLETYRVRMTGIGWGRRYHVETSVGVVVEGGFFSSDAAEKCKEQWEEMELDQPAMRAPEKG